MPVCSLGSVCISLVKQQEMCLLLQLYGALMAWTLEQRHRMWKTFAVYVQFADTVLRQLLDAVCHHTIDTVHPTIPKLTRKAFVRERPEVTIYICDSTDLLLFSSVMTARTNIHFPGKVHPRRACRVALCNSTGCAMCSSATWGWYKRKCW